MVCKLKAKYEFKLVFKIDEVIDVVERLITEAHNNIDAIDEFKHRQSLLVMYQDLKQCGFKSVSVTKAIVKNI